MAPNVRMKDAYSVQRQNLFDESVKWRSKSKNENLGEIGENHDQGIENESGGALAKRKEDNGFVPGSELPVYKTVTAVTKSVVKPVDKSNEEQTLRPNTETFYHQQNFSVIEIVKSMDRFVHLDLKGAPPKLSYLRSLIPLVHSLGATGLLIEYEDMFPYTGMLDHIRAKNSYSMDDIQELLQLASTSKLKVMPLIQTFGHMEFVLKSEFSRLRESDYTPQVIDITQNESYAVITEMVKQVRKDGKVPFFSN